MEHESPQFMFCCVTYRRHARELDFDDDLEELVGQHMVGEEHDRESVDGYFEWTGDRWRAVDVTEVTARIEERNRRLVDRPRPQWHVWIFGPGNLAELWYSHHTRGEAELAAAGLPDHVRPQITDSLEHPLAETSIAHRRYHRDELASFVPPDACPRCGGLDVAVEWIDTRTSGEEPGTWFIPGNLRCRRCQPRATDRFETTQLGDQWVTTEQLPPDT